MIIITKEQMEQARDLITNGTPEAVGYRLMIKPVETSTGMELTQKEEFPTLAAVNFQDKTENQAGRLSKGAHHGILVHKGDFAFKGPSLGNEDWAEVGDVLIFSRYAGEEIELPPGSGEKYRFTNDESILGRMRKK